MIVWTIEVVGRELAVLRGIIISIPEFSFFKKSKNLWGAAHSPFAKTIPSLAIFPSHSFDLR